MSPLSWRNVLVAALVATLIAAWFAPPLQDNGVALSDRAKDAASHGPVAPQKSQPDAPRPVIGADDASRIQILGIRPREDREGRDGVGPQLFASTQWIQSPQKTPVTNTVSMDTLPVPSQAPPLPFRALGRYEDAGQSLIFLQYNDQNLVVRLGDTIAEQYKVESLNGATLTLRYLPLNQLQTLEVGGMQ